MLGQSAGEAAHAFGASAFEALNRAADRFGVELGHREQGAKHVPVCRVHQHVAADAATQALSGIRVEHRAHHVGESAALQQVHAECVEQARA
ncbi:hypothetical protein [Streptomyces sp. NK15101]|uniref:hypothetical protein n=1 Tax=Streptomyces sp. NK15101 TaxID=2873261 RepID=UPI001CEDB71B|nr:hypothetical protein [Streptomyces sp. NK15101]